MNEADKQTKKSNRISIAVILIACAFLPAVFIYLKGYEIYIFGVVFHNVPLLIGVIFEILALLIIAAQWVNSYRKAEDPETRKKSIRYSIGVSAFTIIMLIFAIRVIAYEVSLSNNASFAEREIGDGKSVLLMEESETFSTSTSSDTLFEISVYYRDGIRLKKIGRENEYYYSHNNMVKNEQFEVESTGDTITIHYDYGELTNGMTWKDEYIDNPPEYLDREYKLK